MPHKKTQLYQIFSVQASKHGFHVIFYTRNLHEKHFAYLCPISYMFYLR